MAEVTTLLYSGKGAKIGELQLDATLSEVHKYDAEVTKYPVENGFTITDNIRKLPVILTLQGLITNSPIEVFYEDISEQIDQNSNNTSIKKIERENNPTFVEAAQNALLDLAGRRIQGNEEDIEPKIFSIVTGLRVYRNMVITSLNFPRSTTTGQALEVHIEVQEIHIVTSEKVLLENPKPAFSDKTQSKIEQGKTTPTALTKTEEKKISTIRSLYNTITR